MIEGPVSSLLARLLAEAGVSRVYGIIGTSILRLVDSLYDYRDRVDFVTTRHEQVAVSAADAEARVTGRLGVAAVHAGPGFLNSALSLGVALRDRVPLLLVSGGVARRLHGTWAWLEVDQEAVSRGVAKAYARPRTPEGVLEEAAQLIGEALTPPWGPVVLEVAEDLWKANARVPERLFENVSVEVKGGGEGDAERFASEALDLALEAERPLIMACGELTWNPGFAQEALLELAERLDAFIVVSGNGRGACPEDSERCLGRVGFGGGSAYADYALERSDLVIVFGNEYDDITTYSYNLVPEGDVLVASLDPAVEARPAVYDHYHADPARALNLMLEEARERGLRQERPRWRAEVAEARRRWESIVEDAAKPRPGKVNPNRYFQALDRLIPRERIIAAGQGTHILYAYAYTRIYGPRRFLAATNLGAMAYALPASLGASLALNQPVDLIVGDGDLMMTVQDLETLVREQAKVRIHLVNDNAYKVLYLRQRIQLGGRVYETLLGNPDFQKLAEAFQIPYIRVEPGREAEAAEKASTMEGPVLVEIPAEPDDLPPLNLEYTLKMSQ